MAKHDDDKITVSVIPPTVDAPGREGRGNVNRGVVNDRDLLEIVMNQLYRWARESQSGGWSTHQVEPQRSLASEIGEHLAVTARRKEPSAVSMAEGVLTCLKYPRGSEAQIRCLEEIGQDARQVIKSDTIEAARLREKGG
jgi:hypothetical protein